jgi:hypothetical protein
MRGRRTALGAVAMILALAACGGGGATGSQPASGGTADDPALAGLPQECIDEIRSFLVAVEPIAEGIDFASASEADLAALGPASDAFDPDVCPDVSADEARAAWLAVAEESAPGAIPFIEFTYAD